MKSTDVRIGNICQHIIGGETIGQQCCIDAMDIVAITQFERSGHKSPYYPILLTREWLLKVGLEERYAKDEWSWHLNKWNSYTEITKVDDGYKYHSDYPTIKYVHQLQNLYHSLTGEELVLKADATL